MTQNEPGSVVALTAQTQQVLVQAQRQIEFAAEHVIARLPIGNLKELRRENPAAPTALVRGHRHGPFPARHKPLTACNTAPKAL